MALKKILTFNEKVILVLLLGLTLLVYLPGLSGPFVLDDSFNLIGPLQRIESGMSSLYGFVFSNESGMLGRPVAMASFAANYMISGLEPYYFKAVNLAIHCVTGLLVFCFVTTLLSFTSLGANGKKIGMVVAALWILSPMWVSIVLYPIQRMAQLSTLFVLIGLIIYLRYRLKAPSSQLESRVWVVYGVGFIFATLLAVFSKENGILILLLIPVCELCFVSYQYADSPDQKKIGLIIVLLCLLPVFMGAAYLGVNAEHFLNYIKRDFTLIERVLTETRILWQYVSSLLLPRGQSLGLYHDDIILSKSITEPITTLLSIAGWVITLAVGLIISIKNKYGRMIFGGILFFLASHMLESTVIPLELYFEHRNYLASIGLYVGIIVLLVSFQEYGEFKKNIIYAAITAYVTIISFATFQRVMVWQNWELITETSYIAHPDSPRLLSDLASQKMSKGDILSAEQFISKIIKLSPSSISAASSHLMLGYCIIKQQAPEKWWKIYSENLSFQERSYMTTVVEKMNHVWKKHGCGEFSYERFALEGYRWLSDVKNKVDNKEIQDIFLLKDAWTLQLRYAESLHNLGEYKKSIDVLNWLESYGIKKLSVRVLLAANYYFEKRFEDFHAVVNKMNEFDINEKSIQKKELDQLYEINRHLKEIKKNGEDI